MTLPPILSLLSFFILLAFGQSLLTIDTPKTAIICAPLFVSWTGNQGPFSLSAQSSIGSQLTQAVDFGQVQGNNFTWPSVNITVAFSFGINDNTGTRAQSSSIIPQIGADTNCFQQSNSASISSQTTSTSSTSTSATAAALCASGNCGSDTGNKSGIIAGAVVGSIALVGAVVLLAWLVHRRKVERAQTSVRGNDVDKIESGILDLPGNVSQPFPYEPNTPRISTSKRHLPILMRTTSGKFRARTQGPPSNSEPLNMQEEGSTYNVELMLRMRTMEDTIQTLSRRLEEHGTGHDAPPDYRSDAEGLIAEPNARVKEWLERP